MKQLKVDLAIPIEGGPLAGNVVIYDYDAHPEPLPEIAPTGLIRSRGFVLPVAYPVGYETAAVYRLEHDKVDNPVYRWHVRHHLEGSWDADRYRAELVDVLGIAPATTYGDALAVAYELAECPSGPRHLIPNVDGYCNRCGHYFPDDDEPLVLPKTLAEAITRIGSYRVREIEQRVYDRHRPMAHVVLSGSVQVCEVCRDENGEPVPVPCDDFVDLGARHGFDRERLVP